MPLDGFCKAAWIARTSNFQLRIMWQEWDGQLSPSSKI